MKLRRALSAALAVFMAFAITAGPVSAAETYSDMPTEGASRVALLSAVSNGLLQGWNGTIMPNDPLPRAQMAAIMNRAFGAYVLADISDFTDVPEDAWFYADMQKGLQMQTFKGDGGGRLLPYQNITNEQAYVVIARAFQVEELEDTEILSQYADADQILGTDEFRGLIASMLDKGYVVNDSNYLNPKAYITRAEFAQVMYNMVQRYIRTSGVVTRVPAGNIMVTAANVTLKDLTIQGDLIIGEGVANGDLTLENVEVEGSIVVRGGGEESILLKGLSKVKNIIMARGDGNVRLHVEKTATVDNVVVSNGKGNTIIDGNVKTLSVKHNVQITLKGIIENVILAFANAKIQLEGTAEIGKLVIEESADNSTVTVGEDAVIKEAVVNAPDTILEGDGKIEKVEVNADNTDITTSGTEITVAEGVEGTTAGDKEVAAGETVVTEEAKETETKEEPKTETPATETPAAETPSGGSGGGGITTTPSNTKVLTAVDAAINTALAKVKTTAADRDVTVNYENKILTVTTDDISKLMTSGIYTTLSTDITAIFTNYGVNEITVTISGKDPVKVAANKEAVLDYIVKSILTSDTYAETTISVTFTKYPFSGYTKTTGLNVPGVYTIKFVAGE